MCSYVLPPQDKEKKEKKEKKAKKEDEEAAAAAQAAPTTLRPVAKDDFLAAAMETGAQLEESKLLVKLILKNHSQEAVTGVQLAQTTPAAVTFDVAEDTGAIFAPFDLAAGAWGEREKKHGLGLGMGMGVGRVFSLIRVFLLLDESKELTLTATVADASTPVTAEATLQYTAQDTERSTPLSLALQSSTFVAPKPLSAVSHDRD